MTAPDERTASLADDIVHSIIDSRKANLPHICSQILDEPLVSDSDAADLLSWDPEARLNAIDRIEKAAHAVVMAWLGTPEGLAFAADRQREEEDEREEPEDAAA